MNILLDPRWDNWTVTTDGSGTTSVSNKILSASSLIGERAYLTSEHSCVAGEEYIFSCQAKVTSNNGTDPNPGMFIDHPSLPSNKNNLYFDSSEFKYYELRFVVPFDHRQSLDTVTFGAGSWSLTDGSCEVINPQVRCEKITPMSSNVWARATVSITPGGVLTVSNKVNIIDIEWRPNDGGGAADESNLFVTVPGSPTDLNVPLYPRAFVSTGGPESYIAKGPINITGGNGGQFNIKILDTSTGEYILGQPSGTVNMQIEVVY